MLGPRRQFAVEAVGVFRMHLHDLRSGRRHRFAAVLVLGTLSLALPVTAQTDPLPSWNDGAAKQSILAFVSRTTTSGPDFVPVGDRIAAFDQDGTLWVEQPEYPGVKFALSQVPDLVEARPELKEKQPFKTLLSGDQAAIAELPAGVLFKALDEVQSGMTVEEFAREVNDWLARAKHPRFDRRYTELTYKPMQELLGYLTDNGFRTFIATGGSVGFVRAYSERLYGIPPERVSGSSQALKFTLAEDGTPTLMRQPNMLLANKGPGKIENFYLVFGRRPQLQAGNSSSSDQQAMQYVSAGPGPRLALAILHDDAEREYAYGPAQGLPESTIGTFSQAMYDMAVDKGWIIVSMKHDWNRIFEFEEK